MTLPELIDSLIELSTEDMPDEARKSLDDAIDYIVSSMTDGELQGLLVKSVDSISDDEYEKLMVHSLLSQNLGFA